MKKVIVLFFICLCFTFATISSAYAGGGAGKITGLFTATLGGNSILFISTEYQTGTPSCDVTSRFTITDSNPSYKATLAAAVSAYNTQENVSVVGLGTCNNFSNSEDMYYIVLGSIPN